MKLRRQWLGHAAALEDGIHQRHELAGQSQLAGVRLPTCGQDQHPPCADPDLQERGIPVVESGKHMGVGYLRGVYPRVLPEMYLSEIAEPRVGKSRKDRMPKIDFTQHRVTGRTDFFGFHL